MNNKHYVGKRVSTHELYDELGPITGVALLLDEENEILSGNDSGYMLEIDCKYGTQEMADNILSAINNKTYKGYRSSGATLNPAAELGDGITVDGTYSLLAYRNISFGPGHTSEIAAPGESTLESEYNYKTPSQRQRRRLDGKYSVISKTLEGLTVTTDSGETKIKGGSIETDTLYVNAANISGTISASNLNLAGAITWGDFASDVQLRVTSAQSAAASAEGKVSGWSYEGTTRIDGGKIETGTIKATMLLGGTVGLLSSDGVTRGALTIAGTSTGVGVGITSYSGGIKIETGNGNVFLQSSYGPSIHLGIANTGSGDVAVCGLGGALVLGPDSYGYSLPTYNVVDGQVYFLLA